MPVQPPSPQPDAQRRRVFWHELRSPVATIATLLEVLDAAGPLTPEQRDLLERARRQAARAVEFLGSAQDAEKLASGRLALASGEVDLATLLQAALVDPPSARAKALRLEAPELARPVLARADPVQARRCVETLVRAAVESSHREGSVTAQVSGREGLAVLRVEVHRATDAAQAAAEGTGPSSPLGLRGGGIGLYEARLLVEAMGGSLRLAAEGDTLSLELEFPGA